MSKGHSSDSLRVEQVLRAEIANFEKKIESLKIDASPIRRVVNKQTNTDNKNKTYYLKRPSMEQQSQFTKKTKADNLSVDVTENKSGLSRRLNEKSQSATSKEDAKAQANRRDST